ncbi:aminomethyl-transferring glycine dehydrogenase [Bacteroidota bacterium]
MSSEKFTDRHIGPNKNELQSMLDVIGVKSLDELIEKTVPESIRLNKNLNIDEGISEVEYLDRIKKIASRNKVFKSCIGRGYCETILPTVIQRNILENPSWYTSYTPYQAEISQGRLEALLNFQTVILELTGMEVANASLLDEATAASEAMIMMYNVRSRDKVKQGANQFFLDKNTFEQTKEVIVAKASPLGIDIIIDDFNTFNLDDKAFGAFIQYPAADGKIIDYSNLVQKAHEKEILVGVAADIMSLILLTPPGEWGADIVVGSTQRFGIPMGFGGPHAAYFATRDKFKRSIPGRIIGVSLDVNEKPALRMALQTREQHIKREKATSNICTAQALLATMAGMYAIYHGPEKLKNIATSIHSSACIINNGLKKIGFNQENENFFDTLKINLPDSVSSKDIKIIAENKEINFYYPDEKTVQISISEGISNQEIEQILSVFSEVSNQEKIDTSSLQDKNCLDKSLLRSSGFLNQKIFNSYHSETAMMRYIKNLERKDFSLTEGMISLGSCTMKLNAAAEMMPITWAEFCNIHPFAPKNQIEGYSDLINELEKDLKEITGFEAVSFMPNSGASGEYAGLMVIREYHLIRNEKNRNIVLIPASAHGTNPASAVMAGMQVVVVKCDENGNIDIDDLKNKAEEHKTNLCAIMVTYPSTHGVFEDQIIDIIDIIHKNGGQVYMDGANMNAQVGLTNPAIIGADVCHLNLHKTFAIPHGGGGPGMGPIAVAKHLVDFLPNHPFERKYNKGIKAISAAPYGSASILPISYAYIKLLGNKGLTLSSKYAILNANYLAAKLDKYYKVLYKGSNGFVAHEMILDCRPFKNLVNITEADIAKRLMDYGFHAPTLSFPVHGTLMVEPTESEPLEELDRFVEAMISIYMEIKEIEEGKADKEDNVLINSPHTSEIVISDNWNHKYSREKAAFPINSLKENKFWPAVSRLQDAYGDRNLICSCQGF